MMTESLNFMISVISASIIQRLSVVCKEGVQAYWICPNIDADEDENANDKFYSVIFSDKKENNKE